MQRLRIPQSRPLDALGLSAARICVCALAGMILASLHTRQAFCGKATTNTNMKPYKQVISGTDVSFEMIPIPGGTFIMGSPENETDRKQDEGPPVKVRIDPFWMGKHEVTWDEYDVWSFNLDIQRRKAGRHQAHRTLDKTGRCRHPADQALHRHDLRHAATTVTRPSA